MNGVTIGTTAGNYGKWNNLSAPTGGGGGAHTFAFYDRVDQGGTCTTATCTYGISGVPGASTVVMVFVYAPGNEYISSVTGCSATWITGSGSAYAAFNSAAGSAAVAYALNAATACASVTVTLSAAPSGSWDSITNEYTYTGSGTATIDQLAATNTNTTSCSSCSASGFTGLTGTSDLMVQLINDNTGVSAPSSPYVWDGGDVAIYALNITSGTAPTITQTAGPFQSLGFAFK
jgi:hypothetical protein